MPARDLFHDAVCSALIRDGWSITHDPLTIAAADTTLHIDLAAERLIAAERSGERIAVEVKSFIGLSMIQDLKEAVGQYVLYDVALRSTLAESDRVLYLAIREAVYHGLFETGIGKLLLDQGDLRLLVFDPDAEVVVSWVS